MQIVYVFCALSVVTDDGMARIKRRGMLAGLWLADWETCETLKSACNLTNVAWGFRLLKGMDWTS